MTDTDRATLARDLIADEGTGPIIGGRLMPYECTAGYLTIGFGRNIEKNGISLEEAHFLLLADITDAVEQMARAFPWAMQMTGARQRVLANMLFNMGLPKVQRFRKALAAMKAGDYATAAGEMRNSAWAAQVGARAERLAALMERGE